MCEVLEEAFFSSRMFMSPHSVMRKAKGCFLLRIDLTHVLQRMLQQAGETIGYGGRSDICKSAWKDNLGGHVASEWKATLE